MTTRLAVCKKAGMLKQRQSTCSRMRIVLLIRLETRWQIYTSPIFITASILLEHQRLKKAANAHLAECEHPTICFLTAKRQNARQFWQLLCKTSNSIGLGYEQRAFFFFEEALALKRLPLSTILADATIVSTSSSGKQLDGSTKIATNGELL